MSMGGVAGFYNPEQEAPIYGGEPLSYYSGEGGGWTPGSDWNYDDPWANWGGGAGGDGTNGSGDWGSPWEDWSGNPSGASPWEGMGDFSLGDIGKWLLNLMPGSDGSNPAAALMLPSWLSAYKQWQDADKYKDVAAEAAKYGDPFGQSNRNMYQEMLAKSYTNPEEVLNDPGHQAMLKSGLDTVSRQDAAKGYLGSGNMMADLSAYTTNLNNQYLSQYRKDLQPLTGAQFNPAMAGQFLMQGNEQAIGSQNAALQALMYPFLMNMQENRQGQPIVINNSNQGGNTSNQNSSSGGGANYPIGSGFNGWGDYIDSPESAWKMIQQLTGGKGGSAADIFKLLAQNPAAGMTPSTQSMWQELFGNGAGKPYDEGMGFSGGGDYDIGGNIPGMGGMGSNFNGGTWGPNPFGPGVGMGDWFDNTDWGNMGDYDGYYEPDWWDFDW